MTPEALSEEERRPVDLGAVAEAARGATPGPWWIVLDSSWLSDEVIASVDASDQGPDDCWWVVTHPHEGTTEADAAYIAAASPDVVLALVEAVRVARAGLKWVAEGSDDLDHDSIRADRDACWCAMCESSRALAALDALVEPEDSDGDS